MLTMRVAWLWAVLVGCTGSVGSMPTDDASTADDGSRPDGNSAVDGGPTTLTPGQSTISLMVAGRSRTAIQYVPATATTTSQVAIALHGNGDTASNFLATSGIKALADEDGTVLLVPQGIQRDVVVVAAGQTLPNVAWDAYNSAAQGNIDLPFLDQLRTQVVASNQVDPAHVFVLGYSQGGYLAFAYGMITSSALACSAVLAASSPYGGGTNDMLINGAPRKLAVVLQIGTNDSAHSAAQTTAATLQTKGFPVQFNSIQGAGHVPLPGGVAVPWTYCRGRSL